MASSTLSQTLLPISSTTTSNPPSTATAQVALRGILANSSDSVRHALSRRRPWSELLDRSSFSTPQSFSDGTLRLRKNLPYFRINYYAVVLLTVAVCLLSNPSSLVILLLLLSAWLSLYLLRPSDIPLVLLGRTFSDFETLSLLTVLTVFVVFLTSVGTVVFSAMLVGVSVVVAHAALRVPEDLFLEQKEGSQSQPVGLFSFLRGAAINAAVSAAAAPNTVAARG
ncbi:PRA1 family protein B3-like [Arachis stenosperma]|uniref:PRA1 family protein B3-like n=1 Tax=Arachis stenosperma TaxID=217475 RepID=UPI0025ABAE2E|nr:PRA1 family protein B3-like [Arachis stenosperma]